MVCGGPPWKAKKPPISTPANSTLSLGIVPPVGSIQRAALLVGSNTISILRSGDETAVTFCFLCIQRSKSLRSSKEMQPK